MDPPGRGDAGWTGSIANREEEVQLLGAMAYGENGLEIGEAGVFVFHRFAFLAFEQHFYVGKGLRIDFGFEGCPLVFPNHERYPRLFGSAFRAPARAFFHMASGNPMGGGETRGVVFPEWFRDRTIFPESDSCIVRVRWRPVSVRSNPIPLLICPVVIKCGPVGATDVDPRPRPVVVSPCHDVMQAKWHGVVNDCLSGLEQDGLQHTDDCVVFAEGLAYPLFGDLIG